MFFWSYERGSWQYDVAVLLILVAAVAATEARSGWIAERFPSGDSRNDPTLDLFNWSEVNEAIAGRHLIDTRTPAIAALNWIEAGKLNYASGKGVPILCLCADPQQFRYLTDPQRFVGKDILIIATQKRVETAQAGLSESFGRMEPLAPIILHRGGHPLIELQVIRAIGFKPRVIAVAASGPGQHEVLARR
jgi:hypothetical protein